MKIAIVDKSEVYILGLLSFINKMEVFRNDEIFVLTESSYLFNETKIQYDLIIIDFELLSEIFNAIKLHYPKCKILTMSHDFIGIDYDRLISIGIIGIIFKGYTLTQFRKYMQNLISNGKFFDIPFINYRMSLENKALIYLYALISNF